MIALSLHTTLYPPDDAGRLFAGGGGHYHLCVVPLSLVSSESGTGDEYQLLIG